MQLNQKRNQISRCFAYKNVHEIPFTIEKATFFYTLEKDVSLKPLIRISTFLELITQQRAFILRSHKALNSFKVRKGAPLGAKVTLRKNHLSNFLTHLVWEILPNIKNYKLRTKLQRLKQEKIHNICLTIPDPLVFPILKPFFFLFKSLTNLRILLSFNAKSSTKECFFNARFAQLPV